MRETRGAYDRFSHRLRPDGLVTVTAHFADGRYNEESVLHPSEAKRLAWALLADLDPEEAVCAGLADEVALFATPPRVPELPAFDLLGHAILRVLGDQAFTLAALAVVLERSTVAVGQSLHHLRGAGLALKLEESGAYGRDALHVATPLARELLRREVAHAG